MTNEEKTDEICKKHIFDSNHFDCCMEMAEWKDEQFKIVINKLLKKLAKYDMLDATLCASGLLNLSKQDAQQYIKTLLL